MEYTIDQTENETTIRILSNGDVYRIHTFRADIESPEALAEVLLSDATVDKEREGQPI